MKTKYFVLQYFGYEGWNFYPDETGFDTLQQAVEAEKDARTSTSKTKILKSVQYTITETED